jgi:hypothetical protein
VPLAQQVLQQASAELQANEQRAARLQRLLSLPPDSDAVRVADRLESLIVRIRQAESVHRVPVAALRAEGKMLSANNAVPSDTLVTTLADAPSVGRIGLSMDATFTTVDALEGFLRDLRTPGVSIAALRVEQQRATVRIDLYGRH